MENSKNWLETNQTEILTIILIIAGAWLIKRFGQITIKRIVIRTIERNHNESELAEKQREETIIQIIAGALSIIVWPIAFIIILSQLGVDIGPLIAGASIVGVALGFGAQTLVKDMISGLFVVLENQYRVGDVVSIQGVSGSVERISLRATVLRDLDGIVHHVPNGSIDIASNYSKDFSGINLNVGIAYDSDIDTAIKIINTVGENLAKDKDWQSHIFEAPSFMRVDNLGDSSVDLKITGKVAPLQQWAVTGELRKRLKSEFDKAGIEIPFPQTVIHQVKD